MRTAANRRRAGIAPEENRLRQNSAAWPDSGAHGFHFMGKKQQGQKVGNA